MDDNTFKKLNRPSSCTEVPFKYLIPAGIREETLLTIRQESIDIYGQDLAGECPKRFVCAKKDCLGRPLPVLSPTAQPYLAELVKTQRVVEDELFITTSCAGCPIVKTCASTCNQISDFIDRDKVTEPPITYKPITDNVIAEEYTEEATPFTLVASDIPWDCLNEQRTKIIKMYLYEQKDFQHVSNTLGLNNPAYCKYEFYAGLTKLSEYAVMRKFLEQELWEERLTAKQYNICQSIYHYNMSITEAAADNRITKQAAQQMVARVIKQHKIKWTKFVYKKGNKVIYNVPMIMK